MNSRAAAVTPARPRHWPWRRWRRWLALVRLLFPFLSGCAFAPPDGLMTTVHVEIDLYSGRENPGWVLSEGDAAQFQTRLAAMSPSSSGVPYVPDGLGYRGVHVTVNSDGATQRLVIAAGMVVIEGAVATGRRSLRDSDRGLEKWLLRTGEEYVGAELLHSLLGE